MSAVRFEALRFDRDWRWLAERASCALCEDTKGIVALRNNTPLAMAAFDSWTYTSVTAHIAIEDPMVIRHGFIDEIMRYVFGECGKEMIIGVTNSTNKKLLGFISKLGFEELYRVPDGYDRGIDVVVSRLLKTDWERKNGQEIRRASCA